MAIDKNSIFLGKVDEVKKTFNSLKWGLGNSLLFSKKSEKEQFEFLTIFKNFIYRSIYEDLYNEEHGVVNDKELLIRELVKYTIRELLPIVKKKTEDYSKRLSSQKITDEKELESINNWLDLEDDLYAIASFRSLTNFALYLERDDMEDQLVWHYIMKDVMGGIFYYANAMILNRKYDNLFKQCPTGYGKSKSDCVIICYILGYNPSASIFKVVGNPTLVGEITENVIKMLKSKRFGKVFPEFGKYNGNDRKMFKVLRKSDGEFLLNGSKKARSFFCVNKDTSIDGTRYDYQFYDDVTQSKDRENVPRHKDDIKKYTGTWEKRKSTDFGVIRFFTGTAYHKEDFLSFAKSFYANGRPLIKDIATMAYAWSRFVKLSEDKKSVYVIVPKIVDLELGIDKCYCTFPQKYSKESALKMLEGGLDAKREFYAMEQQTPLPPESLIFDWAYLMQYNKLPQDILENNALDCRAVIDPSRGKDYFCCIIFKKSEIEHTDKWYLVDCFYRRCSYKIALPEIAQKIKKHKVDIIYLENNLDYEELLSQEINKNNYFDYQIETFYTTENKNEKIARQQDDMKDLIIYPQQNMYHYTSEMGQGLSELTSYSIEKKVPHDDFTDCCAIFTIKIQENTQNSIDILDFRIF